MIVLRANIVRCHASFNVHASQSENQGLQSWQIAKLQQAAKKGRRQIRIEKLCKEVEMGRGEVIQWLKDNPAPLPSPEEEPAAGPSIITDLDDEQDEWPLAKVPRSASPPDMNLPPWKRYAKDKRIIGRQAEATLEMIFSKTEWPSDDVVSSMWDLHRLRREHVVEWFQMKRREKNGGKGPSAGKGRRQGGSSSRGTKDWDAEWDERR